MLGEKSFSGYAVKDLDEARRFYDEIVGVKVTILDEENGLMQLEFPDRNVLVYAQPASTPASYTVLNFQVDDVEAAVDELTAKGVQFERYDGFEQDEKGISRGNGPTIAWFKDPSGNVLSVLSGDM
jgi:catechol 2,3-dioxygenase-like lactoylglutathione lyase family enzyme